MKKRTILLSLMTVLPIFSISLAQDDMYDQETFDQSQYGATPFEERGITRPGIQEGAYEINPEGELEVNTEMESYDYWPNGDEEVDDSYQTFEPEERDSWLKQDFGSGADDEFLDYDYDDSPNYNPVEPYDQF